MDMDRFSVMIIYDEGYARICRTIDDSTYREFNIGSPLEYVNYVAFSPDGQMSPLRAEVLLVANLYYTICRSRKK